MKLRDAINDDQTVFIPSLKAPEEITFAEAKTRLDDVWLDREVKRVAADGSVFAGGPFPIVVIV